jgi:hypothetical protein
MRDIATDPQPGDVVSWLDGDDIPRRVEVRVRVDHKAFVTGSIY